MCLLNRSDKKQHSWKLLYLYLKLFVAVIHSNFWAHWKTCAFKFFGPITLLFTLMRECKTHENEWKKFRSGVRSMDAYTSRRAGIVRRASFILPWFQLWPNLRPKRWLTTMRTTTTIISHSMNWKTQPLNHIPLGNVCMGTLHRAKYNNQITIAHVKADFPPSKLSIYM